MLGDDGDPDEIAVPPTIQALLDARTHVPDAWRPMPAELVAVASDSAAPVLPDFADPVEEY